MSLMNILTPRTKDWLDVNFNTLNAKQIDLESADQLVINSAGIVNCQGAPGSANDILTIDGSNNLNWEPHVIGEGWQSGEFLEAGTFVTTSATPVLVTTATFTASGLNAGTYVVYYEAEIQNLIGSTSLYMQNDTDVVVYSNWNVPGAIIGFHCVAGMKIVALTSGTKAFSMYANSSVGGQTTTIRRVRYQIYRVA